MADSKPVKQEVNSTVILFPLVFPALTITLSICTLSVKNNLKLVKAPYQNKDYKKPIRNFVNTSSVLKIAKTFFHST